MVKKIALPRMEDIAENFACKIADSKIIHGKNISSLLRQCVSDQEAYKAIIESWDSFSLLVNATLYKKDIPYYVHQWINQGGFRVRAVFSCLRVPGGEGRDQASARPRRDGHGQGVTLFAAQ